MKASTFCLFLTVALMAELSPTAEAQRRNTRRIANQSPPKPVSPGEIQIPWAKSYDAALEEAAARNVPILVFFIQDGEEANERVVNGVLPNKKVSELADRVICMIASMADHGEVEMEDEFGETKKVCARYGHLSRSERRRAEMEVRGKIFGTDPIKTPLYLLLGPSGQEIWRKEVDIDIGDSASELVTAVMNELRRFGPGLDRGEFWNGKRLLEDADEMMAEGELVPLVEALKPWAKDPRDKSKMIDQLKAKLVEVDQKGVEAVTQAEEAITSGRDVIEGVLDLEAMAEAFEDMETGDAAEEALDRHEDSDAVKALRSDLRNERNALRVLESAYGLEDRGRTSSAVRKYQQIIERYEGTRAARRAAERVKVLDG